MGVGVAEGTQEGLVGVGMEVGGGAKSQDSVPKQLLKRKESLRGLKSRGQSCSLAEGWEWGKGRRRNWWGWRWGGGGQSPETVSLNHSF